MANFALIFDKLLIFDPDTSRSTCHVFASKQSPIEEKNLGKLFLVAEINSDDKINLDIIQTIQDTFTTSYYNTDDLQIESAFEQALENVNQRIADMVGDYDTNWLDKLNIIAVIVKDNTLYFSQVGKLYAFMVRNNKITNIIETTEEANELGDKINPLKAFSNIVSGELASDDALLFCNSNLLDYLSPEKIKRTIQENSPQRSVHILENLLAENSTNTAFAALSIKTEIKEVKTATEYKQPDSDVVTPPANVANAVNHFSSQSSMENLLDKKNSTNQILKPSLSRHMSNLFGGIFLKLGDFIKLKLLKQSPRRLRFEKETKDYRPADTSTQKQYSNKEKRESTLLKSIGNLIKILGQALIKLLHVIVGIFRKRDKIASSIVSSPKTFSQKISNIINKFIKLPNISKILLLSAIVIAFVLAQSIFSSAMSQQNQEESIEFDRSISQISQNILKAEAALSYGNEDGAKDLLFEAQDILTELAKNDKNDQIKITELQSDIAIQLEKTRHIANMAATNIVDFSTVDSTASINNFTVIDDIIYAYDSSKKTIYSADIESGEIKSYPQEEIENTFQYSTEYNNNLVLFNNANGLDEFNSQSNTISSLQFNLPTDDVNIIDMNSYENRVYFLDINKGQIYRSTRTSNGYNQASEWLQDSSDLRNGLSIAIDGNVYVSLSNGQVLRLFQGAKQEWALAKIDPLLESANQIWTNSDTDNIFVLDTKGNRIIEFTKDGKLVNQYVSDSFNNMKSISTDWKNKKTYILNGNSILAIDILN
ncbi:MAG: hypothetical protein ACNFW9_01210 [Candidatus Kerfeldbacteria bacterium]